jgi:hypothetical protein
LLWRLGISVRSGGGCGTLIMTVSGNLSIFPLEQLLGR